MPSESDPAAGVLLRPFERADLDAIVALSLRAWDPFFTSFPDLVGPELAHALHPDFPAEQTKVVTDACTDPDHHTAVAVDAGVVVGFAVVVLDHDTAIGELHLIAVDPSHQRRGIAGLLDDWAVGVMRTNGMRLATVGTGGDPAHAPARRAYERAAYTPIPVVHYFKLLDP